MKTSNWIFLFFSGMVLGAALAEDFKVDGDLTKPVWKDAKPITEFKTRGGEMPMGQKSEIRLLYSSEALYVGATFWQPMATMLAQYDQHDQPIYSDDCLEMFLFVPSEKGPGLWLTPGAIAEIDARLKFAGIE